LKSKSFLNPLIARAREHGLLYVLRKLLELRLWSGSLWAAMSDDPSKHCIEQLGSKRNPCLRRFVTKLLRIATAIDVSLSPKALISDAVKRSSVAHLFHFYPVLCNIASIPRKTPSAWVLSPLTSPRANVNGANGKRAGHSRTPTPSEHGAQETRPVELDARTLARSCLKEVGKEMGVIH